MVARRCTRNGWTGLQHGRGLLPSASGLVWGAPLLSVPMSAHLPLG